jgi:tetratricopeptide (TPR) repeat protein
MNWVRNNVNIGGVLWFGRGMPIPAAGNYQIPAYRYVEGAINSTGLKKFLLLTGAIFTLLTGWAVSLDEGNTLLKNGQIDEAIQSYEGIVQQGYIGHELFFNLGTAYSKKGNISKALYNFEKAMRLSPLDKATRQQIVQINLRQQDKPPIYEDTGLLAFIKRIQFGLGIDVWAGLSIFFMCLFALVVFISYRFKGLKARKTIFLSSILWILCSAASVLMARNSYHYKYLHTEGIVGKESVRVFEQPDPNATISFNLHEGAKVEINDSTSTMYRIQFAEKKGWMLRNDVWKIEL